MDSAIVFPSNTPRLNLPLLFVGQAQKEVTVNESLLSADFLIHGAIEGLRSAPPVAPAIGSMWLIGPAPESDFAGKTDQLAGWSESGWRFFEPRDGMRIFDRSIASFRMFRDGWTLASAPGEPVGGTVIDVEVRAALAALITELKTSGTLSS